MSMDDRIARLLDWIRSVAGSARGLLIPVSGGSDSALCFWMCSQVFPDKTVAVHAGDRLRAREWFERTGAIEYVSTPGEYDEREEMRWARFLAMSLARGFWLVGSRNRTEDELGTYSLASRVTSFMPIVGVWKSDVLAMSREIGVPDDVIASSLRADPDCGRPLELAEIPYGTIEAFLKIRIGETPSVALDDIPSSQVHYLDTVYRNNAFKKYLPIRGPHVP